MHAGRSQHRNTVVLGRLGHLPHAPQLSIRMPSRRHARQRTATLTTTLPALSLAKEPIMPSHSAPAVRKSILEVRILESPCGHLAEYIALPTR